MPVWWLRSSSHGDSGAVSARRRPTARLKPRALVRAAASGVRAAASCRQQPSSGALLQLAASRERLGSAALGRADTRAQPTHRAAVAASWPIGPRPRALRRAAGLGRDVGKGWAAEANKGAVAPHQEDQEVCQVSACPTRPAPSPCPHTCILTRRHASRRSLAKLSNKRNASGHKYKFGR